LKKNEKKILTKEYKFGNIVIVNKDEDTKKRKANKMLRKRQKVNTRRKKDKEYKRIRFKISIKII